MFILAMSPSSMMSSRAEVCLLSAERRWGLKTKTTETPVKTTLLEVLYVLYMSRIWLKTRSTDAEDGATVAALRRALAQAGTIGSALLQNSYKEKAF
jgi:hypothetical protein